MAPSDLKSWRSRLGLTQVEAGQLLGTDWRTYQRFEHGMIFRTELPGYIGAAAYSATGRSERSSARGEPGRHFPIDIP
jgi:hypothetical protein